MSQKQISDKSPGYRLALEVAILRAAVQAALAALEMSRCSNPYCTEAQITLAVAEPPAAVNLPRRSARSPKG